MNMNKHMLPNYTWIAMGVDENLKMLPTLLVNGCGKD